MFWLAAAGEMPSWRAAEAMEPPLQGFDEGLYSAQIQHEYECIFKSIRKFSL